MNGKLKKLKLLIQNKNSVILVIAGKKSYYSSGSYFFFKKLFKNNIVQYYFKSSPYPEIVETKIVAKKIHQINPGLIFAIGGGSVMDLAKIANIMDLKEKSKKKYKTKIKYAKLIAIPLTAGSGAEATSTAVMYIDKKKFSIENKQIKPDYFFLIPDLVKNAPKKIKGPAIFDCIAQSIESIFSIKSDKRSIYYASRSLRISLKYYFEYYKKPNSLNSKEMLVAAHYAGKAIDISRTIASHAMSYPFTSIFNISHGKAVAISFVNVLRYNYDNRGNVSAKFNFKKRFELMLRLTKKNNINQLTNYLQKIIENLEIETKANDPKINFLKNWQKIKKGINAKRLLNNPTPLTSIAIKKILQASC